MTATVTGSRPVSRLAWMVRVALILAVSLVLGGLTFYAQGFLPEWFTSFANSASGWTVLTAALIGVANLRGGMSALLGATSFVLLTVGYGGAAVLNGLYYDPMMFSIIGVVVGPFVGLAACWLRESGTRAGLATAALAGVGVGECGYGLTVVADTTSPVYWVFIGLAGIVLLTVMLFRRIRGLLPVTLAGAGTAIVAAAFWLAYSAI